ncbi:hypothetical protein ID866_11330 [Astraeus odoratus]|nr:hypothetical protein ID866_11330 [Astraeus odoratus]
MSCATASTSKRRRNGSGVKQKRPKGDEQRWNRPRGGLKQRHGSRWLKRQNASRKKPRHRKNASGWNQQQGKHGVCAVPG